MMMLTAALVRQRRLLAAHWSSTWLANRFAQDLIARRGTVRTEQCVFQRWLGTGLVYLVSTQQHAQCCSLGAGGNGILHTHTQPFNGPLSETTRPYQNKHSSTHTHPDHQTYFINFLHLLRSIESSLFHLRAWQSFPQPLSRVLFGLPLGLEPSTSYSMHFFTQSSSFCNTVRYREYLVV